MLDNFTGSPTLHVLRSGYPFKQALPYQDYEGYPQTLVESLLKNIANTQDSVLAEAIYRG